MAMSRFLFFILLSVQSLWGQNPCDIQNLRVRQSACDDRGEFYAYLLFERQNTSDSFVVSGNGKNYGTFLYKDTPLEIGPLSADCTTPYEFVVKDTEHPECRAVVEMGKKCCPADCRIYVDSIFSTCHNTTLDMDISVSRPAQNLGHFRLKINGKTAGTFVLGTPARVKGVDIDPGEPIMEIIACLEGSETCCDTFLYVNPCFCSITGFKTQVFDCHQEDSTFSVKIDFVGTAVSDSFLIGGNSTTYGIYAYNQLPVTISGLPFSDTKFYEFLVIDRKSVFCFAAYELGIVDSCRFNCAIHKPTIEVLPCMEDGRFFVRMQFEEENTSHSGFRVRGNGQLYGTYDYGKHYYDIGPLEADCSTLYEFVVEDAETESCENVAGLTEPVCCEKVCTIREVSVTENCVGDSLLSYTIHFDHNQDSLQSFRLLANGVKVDDFIFGDLPVTVQNITFRNRVVVFKIIPLHNENCLKEFTHEFKCLPGHEEECVIRVTNIEWSKCDEEGRFYIFFSVDAKNHGNSGFKVTTIQTNDVTEFDYGQNRYRLGPFAGDCKTKYAFILQDVDRPDCKENFALETPVCCDKPGDCYIRDVSVTEICEDEKLKAYKINFDHNQDSSQVFGLWANGVKVGEFLFGDLPITVQNITFRNRVVVFKIIPLHNEDCRKEFTHEFDCLTLESCQLAVESFETSECTENGEFFIFFKLKAQNPGNQGFKVYNSQNMWQNTFDYGQQSYKIGPFAGDCETKYRFLIKDVAHPDCAADFVLKEAVCCSGACSLDSIRIENTECIHGLVTVTLNVNHSGTSTSFTLKLNGVVRGLYQYQDLPIVIRQLEPMTTYKVLIQDNDKDCIEDFSFETPECTVSTKDPVLENIRISRMQEGFRVESLQSIHPPVFIQLSDVLGRVLTASEYSSEAVYLPMTSSPAGIYFISLRQNEEIKTVKVIWHP